MTTGAGTSEGYGDPEKFVYRCPNGHGEVVNHRAWIWWCPFCGYEHRGPEVRPASE